MVGASRCTILPTRKAQAAQSVNTSVSRPSFRRWSPTAWVGFPFSCRLFGAISRGGRAGRRGTNQGKQEPTIPPPYVNPIRGIPPTAPIHCEPQRWDGVRPFAPRRPHRLATRPLFVLVTIPPTPRLPRSWERHCVRCASRRLQSILPPRKKEGRFPMIVSKNRCGLCCSFVWPTASNQPVSLTRFPPPSRSGLVAASVLVPSVLRPLPSFYDLDSTSFYVKFFNWRH